MRVISPGDESRKVANGGDRWCIRGAKRLTEEGREGTMRATRRGYYKIREGTRSKMRVIAPGASDAGGFNIFASSSSPSSSSPVSHYCH